MHAWLRWCQLPNTGDVLSCKFRHQCVLCRLEKGEEQSWTCGAACARRSICTGSRLYRSSGPGTGSRAHVVSGVRTRPCAWPFAFCPGTRLGARLRSTARLCIRHVAWPCSVDGLRSCTWARHVSGACTWAGHVSRACARASSRASASASASCSAADSWEASEVGQALISTV